jgi:uncharacterized protein (TIGR02145 family)/M6 family metalloprotease-like protein
MGKRVLLIWALLLIINIVRADYVEKLPYKITQPDGKTISCFISGDEFFNWIHDEEGYTIIQAPDGYYYYAEQDGDLIKPSKYLINSANPVSVGLIRWVKISEKEYQRRSEEMFGSRTAGKSESDNAPHSGIMNNLVIYIRFLNDSEFTTTRQVYDDKFNLSSGVALKSYFREVSYDNITISSTHYPACALTTNLSFQDSHTRNYFQVYNATTNPTGYNGTTEKKEREHALLAAAVNWINLNSPVPSSLNIDADGDNNADNVCFIIKGNPEGWSELLWPHRWSLSSQTVKINGKRVYGYTFQLENSSVRTLCHEMFHVLGAPDLYHYTNQGVISPARLWDIMDNGSGHMLAYMKWKYSNHTWITTIPEITMSGIYSLNPSTSSANNCYKIASPNSANEHFMIEYRNKTGTFESSIPGSGLIVYRIDTRYTGNANGPPDEVYVYRPGGTITVNGTPNDAFFSSTVGRIAINDITNPASFLQNGSAGGLNISNVSVAGTTITFKVTFPADGIIDIDGNSYDIVQIGTQVWMKENLKTSKFNDGNTIPLVTDNISWSTLTTPAYCYYSNNATTYKNTYGALYNWHTVSTGKLCPQGWHVPNDSEWQVLINYLGGQSVAGGKLKESGTIHWTSPNTGATNETGFYALPGGDRQNDGTFYNIGNYGNLWSSNEVNTDNAFFWVVNYLSTYISRQNFNKSFGQSVRCIKDIIPTLTSNETVSGTRIFPNPVTGLLSIEYNDDNERYKTINILDYQGRLLVKEKVVLMSQQIDFSRFRPGLYILEFITSSGKNQRIKILKY